MGKINSRNKGASFERPVAGILREELGVDVQRNLDQWREGGYARTGLNGWAIECKRAKKYSPKWWEQAVSQAGNGETPVLIYKLDYRDIVVELPANEVIDELENEDFRVCMPIMAFIVVVRERL